MNPFLTTTDDATAMQGVLNVTPNDSVDLVPAVGPARPTRSILVGGQGNVNCVFADGSTGIVAVPATACGFLIALAVTRIKATSTTATQIVAFY